MSQPLRIALIGAGRIAELGHLPGFVKAGAEVVALCRRDERGLAALADQYGIARRYTDWRALLDDGGFDAVSICTPPSLHAEMVVASVERGYPTLVEKPMAVSVDECDRMIDAAKQAGVLLMVAHNQRFARRHVMAKDVLDSGRLGPVRRVHAAFTHGGPENWAPNQKWYFDAQLAGHGAFLDLGYHKIDLLRWLTGQEVTDICAFAATFEKPTTADDTVVAALRFSGGALGTLQASWASRPGVEDLVTIGCERGMLHIPSEPSVPVRVVEQHPEGSVMESTYLDRSGALDHAGWFGMAAAFVEAVRDGQPSPVPGEEGRATLATVLEAYAAVAQRPAAESGFASTREG